MSCGAAGGAFFEFEVGFGVLLPREVEDFEDFEEAVCMGGGVGAGVWPVIMALTLALVLGLGEGGVRGSGDFVCIIVADEDGVGESDGIVRLALSLPWTLGSSAWATNRPSGLFRVISVLKMAIV